MIRYHQDANYRSVAVTNIRTKPAFVGGVGFEPTVFLMYWVYSPVPIHHLSSPPIISSGWHDSNVRSPLQHAPVPKTGEVYQLLHIQIINFSKLVNDLKK